MPFSGLAALPYPSVDWGSWNERFSCVTVFCSSTYIRLDDGEEFRPLVLASLYFLGRSFQESSVAIFVHSTEISLF